MRKWMQKTPEPSSLFGYKLLFAQLYKVQSEQSAGDTHQVMGRSIRSLDQYGDLVPLAGLKPMAFLSHTMSLLIFRCDQPEIQFCFPAGLGRSPAMDWLGVRQWFALGTTRTGSINPADRLAILTKESEDAQVPWHQFTSILSPSLTIPLTYIQERVWLLTENPENSHSHLGIFNTTLGFQSRGNKHTWTRTSMRRRYDV